jgi:hypothetical protein
MSDTLLIVALGAAFISSLRTDEDEVDGLESVISRIWALADFTDSEREDASRLSGLRATGRLRLLSREREWLDRDLEAFDRDPRALIKTTVGRFSGSMKETFRAT